METTIIVNQLYDIFVEEDLTVKPLKIYLWTDQHDARQP